MLILFDAGIKAIFSSFCVCVFGFWIPLINQFYKDIDRYGKLNSLPCTACVDCPFCNEKMYPVNVQMHKFEPCLAGDTKW